ncbi:MAG: hypothetical protein J6J23_04925 [Clostridia bacterium]|nr:hypothetical protein [Clostridia bacterium]
MINRGKWSKYYDLPEIQEIREKIIETYTNKLIFLEGPHEYYLDGIQYMCVSDVTHKYKPITGEQMAENCVKKWQRDQDPSYKYYGLTKEEILALWAVKSGHACEFGTEVHAFGESMFYYMIGEPEKILPECADKFRDGIPHPTSLHEEAVVKFWEDIPETFVPVLAETKVFNRNGTPYAGTFDILFYYVNEENPSKSGLVIFDYKTNEDLYKNFRGQKLLWPFSDMLDMNYSYYTLQLGCYQVPLENLGYKVVGRRLIWLKPDGTYDSVKVNGVSDRIREALDIPDAKKIIEENIL